jgi:RNA-binding protein Luc7-like 2
MMGPEAMGIKQQNYDWWDEKVCRNFLFGTCPHLVFGNTVSQVSHSASDFTRWTACFTRLRK